MESFSIRYEIDLQQWEDIESIGELLEAFFGFLKTSG